MQVIGEEMSPFYALHIFLSYAFNGFIDDSIR